MTYIPPFQPNLGLTVPLTPEEIRNNLIEAIVNTNPNFSDLAGSPQNLLVDEGAYVLSFNQNIYINILSGLYPYYTTSQQLQTIGASVGLPKKTTQNLSVEVVFTGTQGAFIPINTIVQDSTSVVKVATTQDITIGSTPTIVVCTTLIGEDITFIAPNTLTQLATNIVGVNSVNNPNPGYGLTSPETDSQYQTRLYQCFQMNKIGTIQQCLSLLKSVNGVNSRLVNIAINLDKTVNIVVGGGSDSDVANAIYISTLGLAKIKAVATTGQVVQFTITDSNTVFNTEWVRPKQANLSITINYSIPIGISSATFQGVVGNALITYVNNLQLGEALNTLQMYNACIFALNQSGIVDINLISNLNFSNFLLDGVALLPTVSGGNLYKIPADSYFNIDINSLVFVNV